MSNRVWHVMRSKTSMGAILALSFLILLPTEGVNAQGVGSTRGLPSSSGGVHTIKGRVFFPDDQAADRHVKVRLESANTFGGLTTVTDDSGQFIFTRLEAGPYTVVVDGGKAFEISREQVSIDREASPGGRVVDVPVYLKLKSASSLSNVPKPALDLYNKAQAAIKSGDGKKAVEHLKGAVAAYPNFPAALDELGVQQLKLGQIDAAVEALESAVKIAPLDFLPRLHYGIALLNQKKFPEAEVQLRDALSKNQNSSVAHMYLGMALMHQKKLEDAQKELEVAVSTNSNDVAMAHRYLGGLYWGNRDYKRAADELEAYLKLAPNAADAEKTKQSIKELRTKQ